MIKKEAQFILHEKIKRDTIIQLKDGKLIFYYYEEDYDFWVYNEKTFQLLFEINIKNLMHRFEINNEENNNNKLEDIKKEIENIKK